MPKQNLVAMGQAGLTRRTRAAALIGAAFLAIALINFARTAGAVIAAGRTGRQPADDDPAGP